MTLRKVNYGKPYVVWFLGAFFFFIDYVLRVSTSVLTPVLMEKFQATAFAIGGFSACFYYAYISMQIPVGILVDRFSPKWLLIMASVICAVSALIFAEMNNLYIGFFSRFLTGFGASFAFVGTLKLISLWFKPERFAFLAGLTQAFGMLGAMVGQGPMAAIYHSFGWRASMYGFFVLFLLISLLMIIFINNKYNQIALKNSNAHHEVNTWQSIKLILSNSQSWLNCLFIGLLYAPSACFGEQWGASFLSRCQGISIEAAGHEVGMMFIGLAIGCPILGWVSDRMQNRLIVMRVSAIACFIFLTIIIYGGSLSMHELLSPTVYTGILFLYGFFNSGIVVSYALASEINPRQLTGMALGVTNMASVMIGAAMIPIVGFILDKLRADILFNNVHALGVQEYQIAFATLLVGLLICFFITFFIKETYCKPQYLLDGSVLNKQLGI
ncbi:MFS transporter [Legionella lytica]|uniref:Lysosomal dipeptide transporter MFSD1 n=1 Tax=Legionella lytica TaxID=96232 RepID=A0ABY4YBC5_9GAMM|nr:MFS transporter [Legionella lytica]USQ14369.1 MFS transporter [Legionella lytica]